MSRRFAVVARKRNKKLLMKKSKHHLARPRKQINHHFAFISRNFPPHYSRSKIRFIRDNNFSHSTPARIWKLWKRKSRSFSTPNRFGWIGKVGLIYGKFRFIGLFIALHLFTSRRFSVFSFRIFTHPKISECLNIRQVIFPFQFGSLLKTSKRNEWGNDFFSF